MIRDILGIFGVVGGGLIAGVLWLLVALSLSAASLTVTCLVIYFFLAAGGVLPPLDYVPFVPNI